MKRLLTLMTAVLMIALLCVPAFAADNTGSITINNAAVGETYKIYKLATLNSFDETTGAYSYSVADGWSGFFASDPAYNLFTVANGYLSQDADGDVTQMPAIAKAALAYATNEANGITAVESKKATAPDDNPDAKLTTVTFTGLELGYYLVDTSLGTLCMLDTTDVDMTVNEKNSGPTIDKTVREDDTDSYASSNDEDLFKPVSFRTQITFKNGAYNYVLHDKMSSGFDFDDTSIEVYVGMKSNSGRKLTEGTQYTVKKSAETSDGCTFEIAFAQAYCDSITKDTNVYVYYQAVLNDTAVIGGTGNPNEAWLSYGDEQETPHDTTTTYTYEFDVVKTDKDGNYLSGAEFTLWTESVDGTQIGLVKVDDNTYRIAESGEETVDTIKLLDGKAVTIKGLDGKTQYYLQEEVAPAGYNKLTSRKEIEIDSSNLTVNPENKNEDTYDVTYGGIQVINSTGAVLPETGGVGTTMFILIGGILVLFSGVLLATKLRMSKLRG